VVTDANRAGTRVLICGVREEVEQTLHSSGVDSLIGAEGIFRASDVLFASTQQALARAEEIVLAERTHGD
jgi:anti-anti-sigma regulatory factor